MCSGLFVDAVVVFFLFNLEFGEKFGARALTFGRSSNDVARAQPLCGTTLPQGDHEPGALRKGRAHTAQGSLRCSSRGSWAGITIKGTKTNQK